MLLKETHSDSKVNGANMVPIWVLSAPDGPHVGPTNLAIRAASKFFFCRFGERLVSKIQWAVLPDPGSPHHRLLTHRWLLSGSLSLDPGFYYTTGQIQGWRLRGACTCRCSWGKMAITYISELLLHVTIFLMYIDFNQVNIYMYQLSQVYQSKVLRVFPNVTGPLVGESTSDLWLMVLFTLFTL